MTDTDIVTTPTGEQVLYGEGNEILEITSYAFHEELTTIRLGHTAYYVNGLGGTYTPVTVTRLFAPLNRRYWEAAVVFPGTNYTYRVGLELLDADPAAWQALGFRELHRDFGAR